MTPAQCRKARKLLGWSQTVLARNCGFNATAITVFEKYGTMNRPMHGLQDRRAVLKAAFENSGIEFVDENGSGPGVRLKKAEQ